MSSNTRMNRTRVLLSLATVSTAALYVVGYLTHSLLLPLAAIVLTFLSGMYCGTSIGAQRAATGESDDVLLLTRLYWVPFIVILVLLIFVQLLDGLVNHTIGRKLASMGIIGLVAVAWCLVFSIGRIAGRKLTAER